MMNKKRLLIASLLLCVLVIAAPAAFAFDFVGWVKNILGIKVAGEQVFVSDEDIVVVYKR